MDILLAVSKSVLAAIVSIIILFALSKIMGNKQIEQLNLFDYINGITIGSIAAEMALAPSLSEFYATGAAMIIYGLTGFFISLATMHSMKARKFFSGEPLVLIENGNIYRNNIKKSKLDLDDLLIAARCAGIYSITDVSLAVMESNGKISFRQTESSRPVTLSDLGQSPEEKQPPVNLIMDGIIMEKNLESAGIKIKKLSDEMHKLGYSTPDDIFLAVMIDGKLTFYPKNSSGGKLDNYA